MPTLQLNKMARFINSVARKCRVYGHNLTGIDCGQEASQWISKYLQTPNLSILVSNSVIGGREVGELKRPWINDPKDNDRVIFAAVTAVHLATEASLNDLNSRLAEPITMGNFRPNVIVTGSEPFDEDSWTELRIGNGIYMRVLEPNPRCLMTVVNPEGKRNADREPLTTLRKYRTSELYGNSPLFGINVGVDTEGVVSVGDHVYVLRKP